MKFNVLKPFIFTITTGAALTLCCIANAAEPVVKSDLAKDEIAKESPAASRPEADDAVMVNVKIPFFSNDVDGVPLAMVGEDKISVLDLRSALVTVHEKMTGQMGEAGKKSFKDTLDRLVNARLVVNEAKNIELDKLPEIKAELETNADKELRQVLFQERVKGVVADEKEVDNLYKVMAREWKLKSIAFKEKADAEEFQKAVKGGKGFDELRDQLIKDGKAVPAGQNEDVFASKAALGPILGEIVSSMKVGAVSQVVDIPNAYVIFKVEDERINDDPELKAQARAKVLSSMKLTSLKKYKDELYTKYVKEKTALLKKTDFESAKPGIEKLLKDTRVVATIKDEKPITMADLSKEIRARYFHGVEGAIKKKKVNRDKFQVLDDMISQRVFKKEALTLGLDKSEAYLSAVKAHETSVLFGTFVEKVVKPDVTVNTKELQDYYDSHAENYIFPTMLQIEDVAFKSSGDAQSAIDKLRKGMDFKWLKNNADNQVDKDNPALLQFSGQVLSIKSFPEPLQKSLDGAKTGDYRYYASPEGIYYVLNVVKSVPSRKQTFDEVKNDIYQTVAWQNFSRDLDVWFSKLREAYPVKMYLLEK